MKAKYTTGPWAVRDLEIIGPINSNKSICEITGNFMDESEAKANAKLIAASPKMIEFISKIMSKLQEHQKEDKKIIAGYTLAANIEGFTDLLNEALGIWRSALIGSE